MSAEDEMNETGHGYDSAMRRLFWGSIAGCALLLCYSFQAGKHFLGVVSFELMIAGASVIVGGLLGFLFGVPHTREVEQVKPNSETEGEGTSGGQTPQTMYRPNTSLEQISDWLTKILVGVGLVEIKSIDGPTKRIVDYLAKGLGDLKGASGLVLLTLVYFSVCGFVFGFLWARIYLRRWFREADQDVVKRLDEKVARTDEKLRVLEKQQIDDANALALFASRFESDQTEGLPLNDDLTSAIRKASSQTRDTIFNRAHKLSSNASERKMPGDWWGSLINVFKALASSGDPRESFMCEAEISYCLSRQSHPDLIGAEKRILKAISIRDQNGTSGWKYLELRHARTLIELDENFGRGEKSSQEKLDLILAGLRVAYSEAVQRPGIWKRWVDKQKSVLRWLDLNGIDEFPPV